ncbi:hypothetical protein LguiB_030376 [Lonicera macranthoides]
MLNQKLSETITDHQMTKVRLEKLSKSETLKEVTKEELKRSLQDSERKDQVIEELRKEKDSMEIQRDYFAKETVELHEEIFRLEKVVFKQKNQLEEMGYISDTDQPDPYLRIKPTSPTPSSYSSSQEQMNDFKSISTYSSNPEYISQEANDNPKSTPEDFTNPFKISSSIVHPHTSGSPMFNLSSLQIPHDSKRHLSIPSTSRATKPISRYKCTNNRGFNRVRSAKRDFSQLPGSLSKVYKQLKDKGMIYPLNPQPIPNPVRSSWNLNERCEYHQGIGHTTDDCKALRHTIQDLIEAGKIPDPSHLNHQNLKIGN